MHSIYIGTTNRDYLGVDAVHRRMGNIALGGPTQLVNRVIWGPFKDIRMETNDAWYKFYEKISFCCWSYYRSQSFTS
ncbi:hypothetical protein [Carnobacterium iners]|uniref:hypothetical protein n=1 Tax=Carnobacterium iners TaxID=1073423 RepID=UPI00190EAB8A|nr:hypothetical protein [Carnobacterium iners]